MNEENENAAFHISSLRLSLSMRSRIDSILSRRLRIAMTFSFSSFIFYSLPFSWSLFQINQHVAVHFAVVKRGNGPRRLRCYTGEYRQYSAAYYLQLHCFHGCFVCKDRRFRFPRIGRNHIRFKAFPIVSTSGPRACRFDKMMACIGCFQIKVKENSAVSIAVKPNRSIPVIVQYLGNRKIVPTGSRSGVYAVIELTLYRQTLFNKVGNLN